jgi:L-cystine uptake protein TcyP (sodium:dicarboxylate symporter family)
MQIIFFVDKISVIIIIIIFSNKYGITVCKIVNDNSQKQQKSNKNIEKKFNYSYNFIVFLIIFEYEPVYCLIQSIHCECSIASDFPSPYIRIVEKFMKDVESALNVVNFIQNGPL